MSLDQQSSYLSLSIIGGSISQRKASSALLHRCKGLCLPASGVRKSKTLGKDMIFKISHSGYKGPGCTTHVLIQLVCPHADFGLIFYRIDVP